MSYVNVLFALKDSHYQRLLDNFRLDANGDIVQQPPDFTPTERRKLKNHYSGRWPEAAIGVDIYQTLSFTFPMILENQNDITAGHKWIEFLKTKWPDVWTVVGCWERDGEWWGVDQIGSAIYPIHPQHMKIMPDDVVYDEDGNEISRTPAAAPKDVNLVCGWSPRRWT